MRISDWSSDVCSSDLDEGGVHRLFDQRLARQGLEAGLEIVTGLPRPEGRAGRRRVVLHMDDRAAGAAPGGQQSQSLRLHARIVAPAPGRVVEGPLDVDGKQDRVIAQHEGASSRYSRSAPGAVVRGRLRTRWGGRRVGKESVGKCSARWLAE